MARNGGVVGRILEAVQDRTGQTVVSTDELNRISEAARDGAIYRRELEYVGWTILNYVGGQSQELTPQARKTLVRKSLNAWIRDPQAGSIVQLYAAFVLGRGVPKPRAHDDEVQDVFDETWEDKANKRILTSPKKLVEKAIDLCIQANVFFLIFDDGLDGRVRLSLLMHDRVDNVVRHPEVRERILYYVCTEQNLKWDYSKKEYVPATRQDERPRTVYYEAIDAFDADDPVMVQQDMGLETPPADAIRPGKVIHLAVNKTSEMAFGVPRFQRMLRWFTAYNDMMSSFVDRMKAAAQIYMKATTHGGQTSLERAGLMAVRRASPLGGAPGFGDVGGGAYDTGYADPETSQVPPRNPGILAQNAGVQYEPFKIDAGAGDVANASPHLRGQTAAASGFPAHYSGGDPGSLAGATAIELPVLKFVELEQESWAEPFRTLADSAIESAIANGRLSEWRDPTDAERALIEAGEIADLELNDQGEVKRDLGYDFALPSPMKRAMTDLVAAAVQTATAVDPNGEYPELSRWLFGFILAEAFDVEDPQRVVDQVLPRQPASQQRPDATVDPRQQGADGDMHPQDNAYGAQQTSMTPQQAAQRYAQEAAMDRAKRTSRQRRQRVADAFSDTVVQTAHEQLLRLEPLAAGTENGNRNGGDA